MVGLEEKHKIGSKLLNSFTSEKEIHYLCLGMVSELFPDIYKECEHKPRYQNTLKYDESGLTEIEYYFINSDYHSVKITIDCFNMIIEVQNGHTNFEPFLRIPITLIYKLHELFKEENDSESK